EAWPIVQNTTSQAILEDFVRQFGTTIYGSLARARLEELRALAKQAELARTAPPAVVPQPAPPPPVETKQIEPKQIAKADPAPPPVPERSPATDVPISDPASLKEIRTRLYELNYDPGPLEGPIREAARQSIREFESANQLKPTGVPTQALLQRLREV